MRRETGHPLNLERLSGRLFFKPNGAQGYNDLGDVTMHKESPETDTVSGFFHTRAATEREVRRDTKSTTLKWEVEHQERTIFNEALLMFGTVGPAFAQPAIAVAANHTVEEAELDVWYDLGKLDIHTVTATVAAAAKIVGKQVDGEVVPKNADVVVDEALGMILFRSAGTIVAGVEVELTYKAEAVDMDTVIEIGKHVQRLGAFRLISFDGESSPARKIIEFDGQLVPKDRGEQKTDDFNKFTFELIATGDVTMRLGNPAQ